MLIETSRIGNFTLLTVEGTITLGENVTLFGRTLARALAHETGHVLVDFSSVSDMDSTGLGELVDYLNRFRDQRRDLVLVAPTPRIRRLLAMTSLDTLFTIRDSLEEAVREEI